MKKLLLLLAVALLIVVAVGWYCSENFSGRLGRKAVNIGCFIVRPGHVVDAILSGNLDGGFGDYRDPVIKIAISLLVWLIPVIFVVKLATSKPKPSDSSSRPSQ